MKAVFAAVIVAALAIAASAAPLSSTVNDPTPMTCLECTFLGKVVEVLVKQGKSKEEIETDVTNVCNKMPMPLKNQCLATVTGTLDPLLTALAASNGDVNTACKSIQKCAAQLSAAAAPTCILCEVEAVLLKRMLASGNTKDQIDTQLQAVCAKLPASLKDKCQQGITTVIDPILGELSTNPNDTPKQACVAVTQCPAAAEDEELVQLIEAVMTVEESKASPLDCIVCGVEAAILSKALVNNTKDQIDTKLTEICGKLGPLSAKCQDCVTTKINPLIDELLANKGEDPKAACQHVSRCDAENVLQQLVEKISRPCHTRNCVEDNKGDCLVCGVEAALLTKAIQNGNDKTSIIGNLTAMCSKIPIAPLQQKCLDAVTSKISPLVDELLKNAGEDPKVACQNVGRCTASSTAVEQLVESVTGGVCNRFCCPCGAKPQDNKVDCLVCGVEAALVQKALQMNSKEQIVGNATALCNKLPAPLVEKCLDAVTTKIAPLVDELLKNQGESPKQACVNVMRCDAAVTEIDEEQFDAIANSLIAPAVNPKVDCAVCDLEASLLAKAMDNKKTKMDIDMKLNGVCNKLPSKLSGSCLQAVANKIDPLIDALVASQNDPKAACKVVQRCM